MLQVIRRYPALASLLLGAAAACGFAPLELWPLMLACFAAWLALVHDAPALRGALWRGWAFGVGHFTINDNWFQHAFDFQDKMPPTLGYAAPIALALYLAVYPAIAAGLAWRFRARRPDPAFVLVFGAAWIVTEWLRATLFTGYAWDPLGVVWLPLIGVARVSTLIGTYALSGLTIVVAGALLLLATRRYRFAVAALAPVALAALLLSGNRAPPPGEQRIRVVQPNVSQDQRGINERTILMPRLTELSGTPGAVPRLIVWPEGVVNDFIEDGYPGYAYGSIDPVLLRRQMARALGPRDLLLTGGTALRFDANDDVVAASNSVFAITPDGGIAARYDKAHLVPYGEYLPMPWLLKPLGLDRLVPGDMDFASGPGPGAIVWPGFGAVGIQICYEIIFSGEVIDRANRPKLLFNPSNDAWFGTWGPPQHLAQARMRAIEEGLPVVRATPNGISAVIAADGRLLGTIPHYTQGAIELPMPSPLPPTVFSRIGNWMAALSVAALLLAAVAIRRRAR